MISVAGIRGIVGDSLTPEVAARFAAAFAAYLKPGPIVVGRDSRPSGPALHRAVLDVLTAAGREAHDLGIVPTPTVQLQTEHRHAAGGIAITASHNPVEWNALKLINATGRFLTKTESAAYVALAEGFEIPPAVTERGRVVPVDDPLGLHLERILELPILDVEAIRERSFRVVLDAVHGAGGAIGRRLLDALGCEVDVLSEEPTGAFPRVPEPLPQHLTALRDRVRELQADVGFAFDPDVDRLALVDERGEALGEDATLALAARFVLARTPGPLVTNLSSSAKIAAVAQARGCDVVRTPVGEANVVEEIIRRSAPIGGEGNGGVILPAVHLGRDGPVGVALILALMAQEGRPLSALSADLPQLTMVKVRVEGISDLDLGAVQRALSPLLPDATIDTRDGLWMQRGLVWIHVRKSGTEPIVRLIAEAEQPERVRELIAAARGALGVE